MTAQVREYALGSHLGSPMGPSKSFEGAGVGRKDGIEAKMMAPASGSS